MVVQTEFESCGTYISYEYLLSLIGVLHPSGKGAPFALSTYQDVFLVTRDEQPYALICCDKQFIDAIRYWLRMKKSPVYEKHDLLHCYTLRYEDITKHITFSEFCKRYGYHV